MSTTFTVGTLTAAPGSKTQGFLEVPGTPVKMPTTIINGAKEGKTIVITGGTHGGEYPGIEASIRLAQELMPDQVAGKIAIVHPVNVPAFQAKLQYVGPYDGKNLNREYPGSAMGTVTQRIAHTVCTELFAQADFYMDLHGGDIHESLTPFVIYSCVGGEEQVALAKKGADAMGITYVCGSVSTNGTFGCASGMGVPSFLAEIGNCGLWCEQEVEDYMWGVKNVLRMLEVIEGDCDTSKPVISCKPMSGLDSQQEGCWYPCVKINDVVTMGQKLGEVRDYFGNVLGEYFAPVDGTMLYVVSSLAIGVGDPLIAIGTPIA